MADNVRLKVETRQFERFTTDLSEAVRRNVIRRAYQEEIIPEFLSKLEARTPVGKSGKAQASWEVLAEVYNRPKQYVVIGSKLFYMWFLEFGTKKMRAFSMLTTTLREYGASPRKITGAIGNKLRDEIRKAMRRGG